MTMDEAVAGFPDNASLMIPGFGPGAPINLLAALWRQGATGLTTISNGVGFETTDEDLRGIGDLVMAGRVKKVIAAFTASTRPSRVGTAETLIAAGSLVIVVLAFNLVGDALRDALDPRADR